MLYVQDPKSMASYGFPKTSGRIALSKTKCICLAGCFTASQLAKTSSEALGFWLCVTWASRVTSNYEMHNMSTLNVQPLSLRTLLYPLCPKSTLCVFLLVNTVLQPQQSGCRPDYSLCLKQPCNFCRSAFETVCQTFLLNKLL